MATPKAKGDAIFMTRAEYERIKKFASFEVVKGVREHRRDELRRKSQEREAKWPNTLAAQRKNKFKNHLIREQKLELERQKIDAAEDSRRTEARSAAISRATKLVYEEKDALKLFRSHQLLSDVLSEQKCQIGEAAGVARAYKEREAYFHKTTMAQIAVGDAEETAKQAERERVAKRIAADQMVQLKEYTQRHVDRMVQERIEGQLIVEKAKRDIEAEKNKLEDARRRARLNNMQMKKENERLEAIRMEEKKKEGLELEKIVAYADERDRKLEQRKEHRANRMAVKQAAQQKMIDRAVEHLAKVNNDGEARLENQVAEMQLKKDNMMKARDDKRKAQMLSIDRSRAGMLARKKKEKEDDRAADRDIAKNWRAQQAALTLQTQREEQELRAKSIKLQTYVMGQRDTQADKRKLAKQRALDEAAAKVRVQKREDKTFQKMLKGEIAEYKAQGKNVAMMSKSLQTKDEIKGFVFY